MGPNEEDNAQVLAVMAEQGDDLSRPREIEFAHIFEDPNAAIAFSSWAATQGYEADIDHREDGCTDVIVRYAMIPELGRLTDLELTLAAAAREHGGDADGWGCFAVPRIHS